MYDYVGQWKAPLHQDLAGAAPKAFQEASLHCEDIWLLGTAEQTCLSQLVSQTALRKSF